MRYVKKRETSILAKEKANLLIEYITQILTDEKKVYGEILIYSAKIDGKRVCTFEISVPSADFECHLNTGVETNHCDVLNEEILQRLTDTFLESETMGVSRYYNIRGGYGMNMNGVNVFNSLGSKIKINFLCTGELFVQQINSYSARINAYVEEQKNSRSR